MEEDSLQHDREQTTMELLRAVRRFSDVHDRMSSEMKTRMRMNITDVAALRLLIMREEQEQLVSPAEIARHLGISTASTTKLLDRLTASGHVLRTAHPSDRRARVIVLTDFAKQEFFAQFGDYLFRMREVMNSFSDEKLANTTEVLNSMSAAIDATFEP